VHITERVLYTEVQRKGSVAYHRDPAAIGFDLPQRQTVTGCRCTQLKPHFPVTHTTRTHHSHTSLQFWTRRVTETLTTPVHVRYQCITYGVHMKWSYEFTVCTLTYIDKRDEWRGNHRGMGLCRMKNIEVTVSGMEWWWGSREVWKRWKMGCSAVSVMAQECTYDEQ